MGTSDGADYRRVYHRNVTLGMEPNAPFAYAPGLEHHHPIVITLSVHVGRSERERDIERGETTIGKLHKIFHVYVIVT